MTTPDTIGKYRIERRLGGGGMAEVFQARLVGAEGFSRKVAIKRILPGVAAQPSFSSLFAGEARISAQLHHPNIVSILDFDRDPEHGLFLVMELVEGRDLAQLLDAGRLLPLPLTLHIITEVLRGLGHVHAPPEGELEERGIVHRDLSPHNVLLSWEGAVKVADFGIAKARVASYASASLLIKGKPAYLSPEQANGEELDGRSDLFAVGVMLWEMLAGRSLFGRATPQETLAALFRAPIPSPSALRPEVPEEVSRVAMRLLERDRAQRYATAEEAGRALLACGDAPRDGRAALAELLQLRFGGRAADRDRALALGASVGPTLRVRSSPRLGMICAAAVLLAGSITAGVAALASSRRGEPAAPAAVAPGERGAGASLPGEPARASPTTAATTTTATTATTATTTPATTRTTESAAPPARGHRAPQLIPRAGSPPPPPRARGSAPQDAAPSGIVDLRVE